MPYPWTSTSARWNGFGKDVFKEYANYNAANFGIEPDAIREKLASLVT